MIREKYCMARQFIIYNKSVIVREHWHAHMHPFRGLGFHWITKYHDQCQERDKTSKYKTDLQDTENPPLQNTAA